MKIIWKHLHLVAIGFSDTIFDPKLVSVHSEWLNVVLLIMPV